MRYRTSHPLRQTINLKTNLRMKVINSIFLCWTFLTTLNAMKLDGVLKRGGAEPYRPFMTYQSLDDFRKKLMMAQRLALAQKVRDPNFRNMPAILLQQQKRKRGRCNRNYNCFKNSKDSNRLNRFKSFHH